MTIGELRCEYLRDPLGIGTVNPRLSWVLRSGTRGERQMAWRVMVASSPANLAADRGDWWDTGRVDDSRSNQIEYAGTPLSERARCWWKVMAWDQEGEPSAWSAPGSWSVGLLKAESWGAEWIGATSNPDEGPIETESPAKPCQFRKRFFHDGQIERATLYVTALGLYEMRLNGRRVGDHLLAPEWTDYRRRVQYQTYDVTAQIQSGENILAAFLGNGWFSGNWQHWQSELKPIYGSQPLLKVRLEIVAETGGITVVLSDNSWRCITDGPLRFSGIYEGETYDARRETPGWDAAGFDDAAWPGATVADPGARNLVSQRSEPIRVSAELTPCAITGPKPGFHVFDFGQNLAGWCRLRVQAPAGTTVTMRFNEMLHEDGTVYMDNLHAGHLSRGDRQIDRYICRGGDTEVYEPRFTYHGFRYVEVTGLAAEPSADTLLARVFHTDCQPTGSFSCSHDLLNRLALNIQWSQRANLMGVPTDCCQRDERCGYTGDMNFFVPTAVYGFDVAAFFNKWLVDLCQDSQLPDGHFADHAPTYGPGDGWNVGWSDAGIICPYVMWRTYGDTRVIREHYAAMRRFLILLKANSPSFLHVENIGNGDWLHLGGDARKEVIGTAYDAYDFGLMSEMAQAIGETRDAEEFDTHAQRIKDAFVNAYLDAEGRIKDSSQTGYALAFTMGLVPDALRAKAAGRFAEEFARFGGHVATGFIGTPRLLPGLHLAGRDDLAYRLLLNEDFPSWLFPVKHGATSIWERWDGWRPDVGFADPGMNSFNHYAFGSVGEYLYSHVAGIRAGSPGFQTIVIQPVVGDGLEWAKARYDCILGTIESGWRKAADGLWMDVTIPVNATATVFVPAKSTDVITESGVSVGPAGNPAFLRWEPGAAVFGIGSGAYRFRVQAGEGVEV